MPVLETSLFGGSEDLTMDGAGNIVAKSGNEIIAVDTNDGSTPVANLTGQAYGLRYGITGDLFVARPNLGTVVRVASDGTVTDFATGLAGPNGVYPDLDGNVWVTEFGGGNVLKFDDAGVSTEIASGQNSPNGVVYDPGRDVVFFTQYGPGKIFRAAADGGSAPVEVIDIPNAALDGLAMDVCGNVYTVDNQGNRLFRVDLDAAGDATGSVLLATFPSNVANAVFGSGTGWEPTSLYAAGNPGDVYSVPVGVAGAPVP
jgi:sugar lactone lactonase YvrE